MSDLRRCTACKGQKKVYGLGGIKLLDCSECNGVGWIKRSNEIVLDVTPIAAEIIPESKSSRKRRTKIGK